MPDKAKVIAFYLPQFHSISENDQWWGKGFTEWTNVAKAKPLFPGHYQPHIPAELGFYDLRVPETRIAQAELAREYGVSAFCYYHYWFAGKQLLERPFSEVLESGKPDFPFCLCWANHSWTTIWQGYTDNILIEQTYPDPEDHEEHFNHLLKAFLDKRYLKVEEKPVFLIWNPEEIPEVKKFTELWRYLAKKAGLPGLYLIGITHWNYKWDPREYGFDARMVEKLPPTRGRIPWRYPVLKIKCLLERNLLRIYFYKELADFFIRKVKPDFKDYPCILPNWDNTPRSGLNGLVFHESSPELFRIQIKKALEYIANDSEEHKIIFVKAWNEWAEGNHLEPDLKFGKAYLEVIKEELKGSG